MSVTLWGIIADSMRLARKQCEGTHAISSINGTPALYNGKPARSVELTKDELIIAKNYSLLTIKPMIYVANMGEDDVSNPESNSNYMRLKELAAKDNCDTIAICAKIECEIAQLDKEDQKMFL